MDTRYLVSTSNDTEDRRDHLGCLHSTDEDADIKEPRFTQGHTHLETAAGAWGAQSVKRPTSAQVTISRSVSSSPASGCVPTARSLEPASDSVSPLSAPPLLMLHLSLNNKLIFKKIFKKYNKKREIKKHEVKDVKESTRME